jgi:dTDP-4-dehydrorhamnose 3,5-epimerase-like enzyme
MEELPQHKDKRGHLVFAESQKHVPFDIKRIFYISDCKDTRGEHGHKILEQFMIAINGNFYVKLFDGNNIETIELSNNYMGLYISPMTIVTMYNFSCDAICLVFASDHYNKEDYFYNF